MAFNADYTKAETQKLKSLLLTKTTSFGSTPSGVDWCIKALHPSDPLVECRGIPDKCSASTVLMNYQSTYRVRPTANSTGPWGFDGILLPNPVDFLAITAYDSVNPAGVEYNFCNSQIDGLTYQQLVNNYRLLGMQWRLAYMSVTAYQDGPALADQGTLTAAQAPMSPSEMALCWDAGGAALQGALGKWLYYSKGAAPDFDTMQGMPNCYFNRSKEGMYMPLKLEKDAFKWRSNRDLHYQAHPTIPGPGIFQVPTVATYPWPIYNCATSAADHVYGATPMTFASPATFAGDSSHAMLNSNWGFFSARNLDVTTSFTFYVRCGIEFMVDPVSPLAPQMKLSPPYDPEALKTYFSITRELKDAYPADFNDLGKMWDVISGASRYLLPKLSGFGPYGKAAAMIGGGAVALGDTIRERRQAGRDRPSAAAVERAREEVAVARAIRKPVVSVKKKPVKRAISARRKVN